MRVRRRPARHACRARTRRGSPRPSGLDGHAERDLQRSDKLGALRCVFLKQGPVAAHCVRPRAPMIFTPAEPFAAAVSRRFSTGSSQDAVQEVRAVRRRPAKAACELAVGVTPSETTDAPRRPASLGLFCSVTCRHARGVTRACDPASVHKCAGRGSRGVSGSASALCWAFPQGREKRARSVRRACARAGRAECSWREQAARSVRGM